MYLARFEGEEGCLVGAVIRIRPPAPEVPQASRWWSTFGSVVGAVWRVRPLGLALRVAARADGSLIHQLHVLAPEGEAPALRHWVGCLTRLDRAASDSVLIALDRAQHDTMAADFPRRRARVSAPAFRVDRAWVACDFRVFPSLGRLLELARAVKIEIGVQVNLAPVDLAREIRREIKANMLALSHLAGIPEGLLEMQQALASRVEAGIALTEEFVAAETPEASAWLEVVLRRDFGARYQRLGFEFPGLEVRAGGYEENIVYGMHSSLLEGRQPGGDEVCATTASGPDCEEILGWRSPASILASDGAPVHEPDEGADAAPNDVDAPEPCRAEAGYVFVSYRHADLRRIAPTLCVMASWGVPLWYDRGIPGGAEWDAFIEKRIELCDRVVLFVSPAAVASKYVRREVKFADAVDKQIVTVVVEPTGLADGLRMLLSAYQMLDASAAGFHAALQRALQG